MAKKKRKAETNGAPKEKTEKVTLELRHVFGDEFKHADFCNHVTFQCDGGQEFHLSFFDIQPPLFLGPTEDRAEHLESIGHIEARCVAHVAISSGRMPGVVRALVDNVVRHIPEAAKVVEEALEAVKADQGDS